MTLNPELCISCPLRLFYWLDLIAPAIHPKTGPAFLLALKSAGVLGVPLCCPSHLSSATRTPRPPLVFSVVNLLAFPCQEQSSILPTSHPRGQAEDRFPSFDCRLCVNVNRPGAQPHSPLLETVAIRTSHHPV